ncbi:MAG: endonuclease/exonuclease/phosphatase family protein [Clostridia bacterium]|nr:endonuclease/exonuclease/phosphatase family protein [Clostridia bacterium]
MKLLTLNTHSVIDEGYERKVKLFADAIARHKPDVIALQEVMQPANAVKLETSKIKAVGKIPVKKGNFLFNVMNELEKINHEYFGVYFAFKRAYDKYDEGLAIISSEEITSIETQQLSPFDDYNNYKTRHSLGVRTHNNWFYSLHFNWENDSESPFIDEWRMLYSSINQKKNIWLMGDFNITPASEGYQIITKSYNDTYIMARDIDNGITVGGEIDGWHGQVEKKRIDYIFTGKDLEIKSSKVIFNGKNEDIISDHFGVIVEKE